MKDQIVEELCTLVVRALMEHKVVDLPPLGIFEVKHNNDQAIIDIDDKKVLQIPEDVIIFNSYPSDGNK
jgi:nucleoid DNA-binding protein